jgi:hypothetical protein
LAEVLSEHSTDPHSAMFHASYLLECCLEGPSHPHVANVLNNCRANDLFGWHLAGVVYEASRDLMEMLEIVRAHFISEDGMVTG